MPEFRNGEGEQVSGAVRRSKDICANAPFPDSHFLCNYGAVLNFSPFTAMSMKHDIATIRDVGSRLNLDTVVGLLLDGRLY